MSPFPFAGDAPAGGVTFSHARESNQRARSSSQSPLTPFPPTAKTAFAPLLLLSPQSLKDGFAGTPCIAKSALFRSLAPPRPSVRAGAPSPWKGEGLCRLSAVS